MTYKVELKEEANKELGRFTLSEKKLIFKQIKKIANSPELGTLLGNKSGYNLSGCRKMYVDKKRIRIVYTIFEEKIIVMIIAIGKRDDMEVYKKASERL